MWISVEVEVEKFRSRYEIMICGSRKSNAAVSVLNLYELT